MDHFPRRSLVLLMSIVTVALAFNAQALSVDVTTHQSLKKLSTSTLAFTENKGQWDAKVKFKSDAGGATIWFTSDGVYYQFVRVITQTDDERNESPEMLHKEHEQRPDSVEQLVIRALFKDANPDVEIVGDGMLEYKCNYFIGNDPMKWCTNVPNYAAVTLHNIYEGIDLRFQGNGDGCLMYEYSVAPGAAADRVVLEYDGSADISRDESGAITARTIWGDIEGVLAPPDNSESGSYDV